jgi:hypothetical protein
MEVYKEDDPEPEPESDIAVQLTVSKDTSPVPQLSETKSGISRCHPNPAVSPDKTSKRNIIVARFGKLT